MSFPITHIKANGIELTSELRSLVTQKLSPLEKFIGAESDVSCDIVLEKTTGSQSGNIFKAEATLFLRGKKYRAEATLDQIEKAIDEIRNQLDKELRRGSDREMSLMKKGGRKLKAMFGMGV